MVRNYVQLLCFSIKIHHNHTFCLILLKFRKKCDAKWHKRENCNLEHWRVLVLFRLLHNTSISLTKISVVDYSWAIILFIMQHIAIVGIFSNQSIWGFLFEWFSRNKLGTWNFCTPPKAPRLTIQLKFAQLGFIQNYLVFPFKQFE